MNDKVKSILKEVLPFLVLIIVVLLIKWFIVRPVQVKGDSMYPTLEEGDIMLLNEISYKIHGIKRFDIVVIDKGDELLIKRVIGLPGEEVEYKDNVLYINGEVVKEPIDVEDGTTQDFKVTIQEDYYFVMGDNRTISWDSRELGAFHISKIKGTTSITLFPFNRFGKKK